MLSLIYISRVVPSRLPIDGLFRAILDVARTKNKEFGITGLLVYSGGYWVQLLEGERTTVLELYANISRDERHTDVTILSSAKITKRSHTEWVMAGVLLRLSSRSVDIVREMLQIRDSGATKGGAAANDYFRYLLSPMCFAESAEEAKFTCPVRHIAVCATSIVWLNTFFTFLRDLMGVKIESLIASDPFQSNPNYPIDYCDVDHPQFGLLRITSIYADMIESPLAAPLLHRTDYLLGLFAHGSTEKKLNFANRLFQHPSIIESRPATVLVSKYDDTALKSLITQYVTKAKLPRPTFLAANIEPKNIWENIVEWLKANPIAPIVADDNLDFEVIAPYVAIAEPVPVATIARAIAPVSAVVAVAGVPVTPVTKPAPAKPTTSAPNAPMPEVLPTATVPAAVVPTSVVQKPAAVTPGSPTPVAPAGPAVPVATSPAAPIAIVENLELDRIFKSISTMHGFRFAAIADTQSSMRTSVCSFNAATPDDQAAFATALPLLQEWLTLGVTEFPDNPQNKTIHSLVISAQRCCRFAYKLSAEISYALIFELERDLSNIALTNLLVDEIRADFKLR